MITDLNIQPAPLNLESPVQQKVTAFQEACKQLPQVDCPLKHHFTPGLYYREFHAPAGAVIVSKIHKTEHPFVILKGIAEVWDEHKGKAIVGAGHLGVTKPGTRRILHVVEDIIWVTFHPTDKTDVAEIEKDVIYNPEL